MSNEDQTKNIVLKICEKESELLWCCPFCGGKAEFYLGKNTNCPLHIRHLPDRGIICPSGGWEQVCDTFEQGIKWWNTRVINSVDLHNRIEQRV